MMTERQRQFREKYVSQISPWYHGLVHIGVMYGAGIAAIWWCVSRMQGATWEWLLIVPVAIAGYVVFITMIGHYMVYETFHFCCHVPDNWFVRNVPFVNTIRRHHIAHHNMGIMMHVNMNLTFPIADWALRTSDLRRGLFGHLFNGFDERYLKDELKPVIAKFRTSETQDAR